MAYISEHAIERFREDFYTYFNSFKLCERHIVMVRDKARIADDSTLVLTIGITTVCFFFEKDYGENGSELFYVGCASAPRGHGVDEFDGW